MSEQGISGRANPPVELRSPAERRIARSFVDDSGAGKPLSRRSRQTRRTVENYLAAGFVPRYVRRLREIEQELARSTRQLERARRMLVLECAGDARAFERAWTMLAHRWGFDRVNELIREHNEWYPIERALPLNPRSGDYVSIRGRSYRRAEVGAEWVLERFPAAATQAGEQDRRAS